LKPADRRADSRTATRSSGPAWLREDGDGVLLLVHLQPGARRTALCGEHGGRLKIAVAAPPLEGRANDALIAFLAELLGLLHKMTDEQLHTPFGFPWGGQGTIEDLVEIFAEHEETHAKEIREIIEKGK